jgi:hypothetical protein
MSESEKFDQENTSNNHAPCTEFNCSYCCDPVKIAFRKGFDPNSIPIPLDSDGVPLWVSRGEVWIPEHEIDHMRIQTYDCKKT